MQLFAFDRDQNLLLASFASKTQDYLCPECSQKLKVRGGPHRRPHYYHLQKSPSCRQHQKSIEHIQTQLFFLEKLPKGDCFLEHPFPTIGRIADVFWKEAKIVFEIQCSPISKEEVQARGADYAKEGLEIVWILHDKRFNKKYLSSVEEHLRNQPCYYTDISPSGAGRVYDQSEILIGAFRKYKSPPFAVQIENPQEIPPSLATHPSKQIQLRAKLWNLGFAGDLLDRVSKTPTKYKNHLTSIEQRFFPSETPAPYRLKNPFKRILRSIFDALLRTCSKEF